MGGRRRCRRSLTLLIRRGGRCATLGPGTPAEVVLRMLILKHLYDRSFDECEREVRGSLVYRAFCRIDCELLARAAHPALKASRGAIVAVASMSGSNPHANLGAYGPSKAALIMLVRVLAQELGRDGIRVNALSPGMVRTGMTAKVYADPRIAAERDALVPLGRVATPEDMADVIAFLLGPDARYVNGHDLIVDGGVSGNLLGRLPGLSQITRG